MREAGLGDRRYSEAANLTCMGRRKKRHPSAGGFWTTEYGGMPMWGVAASLVVILGLGSIALVSSSQRVQVDYSSPRPNPIFSFHDETPTPTAEPVTVAILGDSFSPPIGQPVPGYSYAAPLASEFGWRIVPFGQGGTGYTNPGQAAEGDDVFAMRVPAIIAAAPSIVIVQGSTNDSDYDETYAAASAVYAQLRGGLPDAKIIVVGPLVTPALGPDVVGASRDAVRDAATDQGLAFIDPIELGWLGRDATLFVEDGVHPTTEGQAQIAELLRTALTPIVAP